MRGVRSADAYWRKEIFTVRPFVVKSSLSSRDSQPIAAKMSSLEARVAFLIPARLCPPSLSNRCQRSPATWPICSLEIAGGVSTGSFFRAEDFLSLFACGGLRFADEFAETLAAGFDLPFATV